MKTCNLTCNSSFLAFSALTDEIQRGSAHVWGFIAQEVRDTLPYATQTRTECLPNIYELANVSDNNVITFANFDTSNLESNALVLKVFDKYDSFYVFTGFAEKSQTKRD